MQFFLNSLDVQQIHRFARMGVISGVTSNPSMAAKATTPIAELVREICTVFSGPVSVQVTAIDVEGMLANARILASLAKGVVIKLPCTTEGMEAAAVLKREGVPVNLTLCFSLSQALWALNVGTAYVSVFSGRLMDEGKDGEATLREVVGLFRSVESKTRVIAASLNSVTHVLAAARAGSHIATTGPAILEQMLQCAETRDGLDRFLGDWSKSAQAI
jgi:transaldolase